MHRKNHSKNIGRPYVLKIEMNLIFFLISRKTILTFATQPLQKTVTAKHKFLVQCVIPLFVYPSIDCNKNKAKINKIQQVKKNEVKWKEARMFQAKQMLIVPNRLPDETKSVQNIENKS